MNNISFSDLAEMIFLSYSGVLLLEFPI